jgi:hypothetical protein
MRATLLMMTLCSAQLLSASQEMSVTLCDQGGVGESVVAAAKAETELVYGSADVRIVWHDCDDLPASPHARNRWFIIRLRGGKPPVKVGASSLDAMGKSFVVDASGGNMADAYYLAVQSFAAQHHTEPGVLLGFVIAHELGHLLLGPGHTPDGVMQAVWGDKQSEALRQRWLKFSKESTRRIKLALQSRTGLDSENADKGIGRTGSFLARKIRLV